MTVQDMLESGRVDDSMDTESLELAQGLISEAVELFRSGRWGKMGEEAIKRYNCQLEEIQQVLNKRRGIDGMTPLAK